MSANYEVKGGVAVITVPNDPLINRLKSIARTPPLGWMFGSRLNWGGDHYHLHVWRPDEFRALLARHFRVDEAEVRAEVYGIKNGRPELIDPHRIFQNRWLGYDNIRRNVLISVLDAYSAPRFCRFLKRKFPEYDEFAVAEAIYPSNIRYPGKKVLQAAYRG